MFSIDTFSRFNCLRLEILKVINDRAITIIPIIDIKSGCSSSSINQLKIAPDTGIRNFHTLRIDTLTPGRLSRTNHIEIAEADKKLSHASEAKYSGGNGPVVIPSMGTETINNIKPPIMRVEELIVSGEREDGDLDTNILA